MSSLHYLYEYSLNFFMDTIMRLLEADEKLRKLEKKDYEKRKERIYNALFEKIFLRVANSLLSKDLVIFCLKLVSIKLPQAEKALFSYMVKPSSILTTRLSKNLLQGHLSEDQLKQLEELSEHPVFCNIVSLIEQEEASWLEFLGCNNPEDKIPPIKC